MELREEQKSVVAKLVKQPSNFLAADIGSGKTIMSLKTVDFFTNIKKILVICPLCVVEQWENAIKTNLGEAIFNNTIVINYDKLIIEKRFKEVDAFTDKNTFIILDEAHRIKNVSRTKKKFKTKRVEYVMKLKDKTKYKMCLTGTPQNRKYIDFMNGLNFLDLLPITLDEFEDNFCIFKTINYGGPYGIKTLTGYRNTKLLDSFIAESIIFHKLEKAYEPEEYEINIDCSTEYKKIAKAAIYEDEILTAPKRRYLLDIINSKNKCDTISDMLEDIEERVVIFYKYDEELKYLKELADKIKRPYSEYNGHKKDLTNFEKYDNGICFNNFGSGAEGTNAFIKSHIMIFMQYCDYLTFVQSKGRIDRIGQTKTPVYYYLLVKNTHDRERLDAIKSGRTYDERMYDVYINKYK